MSTHYKRLYFLVWWLSIKQKHMQYKANGKPEMDKKNFGCSIKLKGNTLSRNFLKQLYDKTTHKIRLETTLESSLTKYRWNYSYKSQLLKLNLEITPSWYHHISNYTGVFLSKDFLSLLFMTDMYIRLVFLWFFIY